MRYHFKIAGYGYYLPPFIEDSIKLAQATVQNYLERCHSILKTLKEKLDLGDDQTSLNEFSSILDLITDRVF